ncbi:MAG: hypothetical protein GXO86_09350 [Chlorobi bacterium]|nr:hypothetical protein [Chlorobiota bacterium]
MKTNLSSNWWSFTLSGIIAILYAFLAFYNPEGMLETIIGFFGIILLIVGISMLIGVVSNIRNKQPYATDLVWAILTIIIGGVLKFYTQETVFIFVVIIGIWAILMGIIQLYFMTQLDKGDKSHNSLLINGIVSIVFGIILFFNPFTVSKTLLIITGVLALFMGIFLIVLSLKIKNFAKNPEA